MSSLGKKYICFKCSTKFYDLNKPDPTCPKCGVDQRTNPNPDPQEILMTNYRRPAAPAESSRPSRRAAVGEDEEIEEEFEDDFLDESEGGIEEEDEDFGDLDDMPEDAEEEDYD